jgi:AcrR family transcriptional regulator
MKKQTQRQQQAIDTKNKILCVIREMLKKKSFDELRIEEICRNADVSVGAFYHHFMSKDGIIIELYRETDKLFETQVAAGLQAREPAERVLEYLMCQCEYAQEMGISLMQNVYKAQINHGNRFFLSAERGLPRVLEQLVKKAQESGQLDEAVPAKELTAQLLLVSRGVIYNWCQREGNYDIRTVADSILRRFLSSFRK